MSVGNTGFCQRRGKTRCARDWTPRGRPICWPDASSCWAPRNATVLRSRRFRVRANVGSTGCRARSWRAAVSREALRALARRYGEPPAGTPGTHDPGVTGSVADASEPKDFQEVAGHGTPSTPVTRQSNSIRREETDAWGLTAADRADGMTRLRETAPPQSPGPNPEPPAPAPPAPLLPEPGGFEQRQDDDAHAALVAGLHVAARGRPPSWADAASLPSRGCFCKCCKGQRWW